MAIAIMAAAMTVIMAIMAVIALPIIASAVVSATAVITGAVPHPARAKIDQKDEQQACPQHLLFHNVTFNVFQMGYRL